MNTTIDRANLVARLRAEAAEAEKQLKGVPGVVAGGILHLAALCREAALEIERGNSAWKGAMEERDWWENKANEYKRLLPASHNEH